MKPILFWVFGIVSLVACFLAVAHRRPQRSTQGLVAMMMANAVILFLLSAPLLAIELMVVTLGATLVVWAVLVRPKRMRLGTPGRTRYNITKFVAFFVALWLSAVLVLTLFRSPEPVGDVATRFESTGEFGAVMSVFLLGVAATTTYLMVRVRRRQDDEGEAP